MRDRYQLPRGYVARRDPQYFDDVSEEIIWQPHVYEELVDLARATGASRIIDLGCGAGGKLVEVASDFETIGFDFGSNIQRSRDLFPDREWREADLDAPGFRLSDEDVTNSVLICADVLEHLVFPERLLGEIRRALDAGAHAVTFSTPDRGSYYGASDLGPPPNLSHVREWTMDEFRWFLESMGFTPLLGLTQSNDDEFRHRTTFAVCPGLGMESRVLQWWQARKLSGVPIREYEEALSEHERLLVERDAALAAKESQRAQEVAELDIALKDSLSRHEGSLRQLREELAAATARVEAAELELAARDQRLAEQASQAALPAPVTNIASPKTMPRAAASGLAVLFTKGPREFSRRLVEWAEGRRAASARAQHEPVAHHPSSARSAEEHLSGAGQPPEVSIVIPVWNALAFARECLASVLDTPADRPLEVIVVDNGSAPDVRAWLEVESARSERVGFIRLEENVGFAAGVNIGCRRARGKYLVILNSDTLVTPHWLEPLLAALDEDESIAVTSPSTNYVGEGMQLDPAATDLSAEQAVAYAATVADRSEIVFPPERMAFFCVAMPRDVFDLLNGFDESFGLGNFEDEDFCLRVHAMGRRIAVVRNSFVFHHGSKTFEENEVSHSSWMVSNLDKYLDKVGRVSVRRPHFDSVAPKLGETTVSVIVRTRDRRSTLELALNSLANQTFKDFEVVLVNDGGADVSDLVARYEGLLRIQYVWNRDSHGQAQALNDGLSASRGEYVAYLDDDDVVYPFHLTSLIAHATSSSDKPFVFSHYNRALVTPVGSDYVVVERKHPAPWKFDRDELLVQNRPAQHTWLHTRALAVELGGFDTSYSVLQDWDFILRATRDADLIPLHRETCEYRIYTNMGNSISSRDVALADLEHIYEQHPTDSGAVRRAREREHELLRRQTVDLRSIQSDAESGVIPRVSAIRQHLSMVYGFDAGAIRI